MNLIKRILIYQRLTEDTITPRRNDETLSTIKLKCPGPDLILRTTERIRIEIYALENI